MVKILTKEDFKNKIFNYEINENWKYDNVTPCIIEFGAKWCGPCRQTKPILENLSNEYNNKVDFYEVDVDEEPELADIFKIRSIPTMLFIPLKGEPQMTIGASPKNKIIDSIKNILKVNL